MVSLNNDFRIGRKTYPQIANKRRFKILNSVIKKSKYLWDLNRVFTLLGDVSEETFEIEGGVQFDPW